MTSPNEDFCPGCPLAFYEENHAARMRNIGLDWACFGIYEHDYMLEPSYIPISKCEEAFIDGYRVGRITEDKSPKHCETAAERQA
jgi:hypothetical protein